MIVHGGFIIPFEKNPIKPTVLWGSGEAEIAQWGSIPAERIVGFVYLNQAIGYRPDGPIFMRSSFRKKEPKAFETIFNTMSGMKPS